MFYYIKVNEKGFIVDYRVREKKMKVKEPWHEISFLSHIQRERIHTDKNPTLKFNGVDIEEDTNAVIENMEKKQKEEKVINLNINKIILELCDSVNFTNDDVELLRELLNG